MKKPNIVFYFSDQQRYDTCGCYGQDLPITPHLDDLAKEGVQFEYAFSPQPVCGPCRAIFQTGLYATTTGCFRNSKALPKGTKTIAHYLQDNGYETAYVGKWHLASEGEMEQKPTQDYQKTAIPPEFRGGYNGFWRVSDVLEFTSDGFGGYVFDEHMNRCEFSGYRADCMADYALEFLDGHDTDKPFFLTVSQIEPHHQNDAHHYQGPKGSKEKYKDYLLPEDLKALGGGDAVQEYPDYLGACAKVDENLGRLIEKLKEKGVYEDTYIIFTSDHGSHFRTRNRDDHLNGFDDYKRTAHDAALRVPLVIHGGKYIGGKVIEELVSTGSIAKTILSMAGIEIGNAMICEDLTTLVDGDTSERANEVYAQISESRVGRAIRTERYLYAVYAPNRDGGLYPSSDYYVDDYMHDLSNDPHQLTNIVDDNEYLHAKLELRERLKAWILNSEQKEVTIEDDCKERPSDC
ncbi:sulfatase-like hydrolase/transferase [Sphaerochaeta halotolerans]|uniref:sulfatase-like hydrolase/transferase n=1 Tax=Sphaerochaeta halotolerans TaxID=2293840 RepID=UPI00136A544F|nr:sulfatase-like hydrolase/transferase [Sphaerochaeta halotolerans]MXI87717.1 sulfatase-like hydrolase/transferase [Sphaerochaeta halotolerans]